MSYVSMNDVLKAASQCYAEEDFSGRLSEYDYNHASKRLDRSIDLAYSTENTTLEDINYAWLQ